MYDLMMDRPVLTRQSPHPAALARAKPSLWHTGLARFLVPRRLVPSRMPVRLYTANPSALLPLLRDSMVLMVSLASALLA